MKKKLTAIWNQYAKGNPVLPWVVLFLFLALLVTQYGGVNARARIASLRAVTENFSFHIDRYKDWTIDWSQSPNGHFYSNKPPGGLFVGLPVFAATDLPALYLKRDQKDKFGRVPEPNYAQHLLLILFTQLLPFSFLVLLISKDLETSGVSLAARHFFALAALFGNTASIYMNSYFGHGMSGMFFLAAYFFWHHRRWAWSAFFLSFCLLNDYGTIFVLPAFVAATLWRERDWRPFVPALLASLPAAFLWCWYHTVAFGSPFALASQFTNPTQMYVVPDRENLWGAYSFLPSPEFFWKLLFGPERGISVTQPWILAQLPCLLFFRRERALSSGFLLVAGGLAGLLWMNSGFGGWHGGWTLGPRYLSLVFPAFALLAALGWARLHPLAKVLLWTSLGVALLFRWLVLPFSNLAPSEPIWAYHLRLLSQATSSTPYVRLAISGLAILVTLAFVLRAAGGWKAVGLSRKAV